MSPRNTVLLAAISLLAASAGHAHAGLTVTWSAVTSGGTISATSGAFTMGCSIGQPAAGVISTSAYRLVEGYWAGATVRCPADYDHSGFVDTDDFTAFVADFELGIDAADFDKSGFVDTDDFTAFVLAFEAGC